MIRAAVLLMVMWASPVAAHGSIAGGGGFYGGLAHPFLALDHFLLLMALGLTLGHARQTAVHHPALGLMAGALVGLWLASRGTLLPVGSPALLAGSATLGLGLAAAVRLPGPVATLVAGVVGLVVGNGTDVVATQGVQAAAQVPALSWAGTLAGLFLIAVNAAALSAAMRRPVLAVARRVMGSWLAAIALMVIGLQLSA